MNSSLVTLEHPSRPLFYCEPLVARRPNMAFGSTEAAVVKHLYFLSLVPTRIQIYVNNLLIYNLRDCER